MQCHFPFLQIHYLALSLFSKSWSPHFEGRSGPGESRGTGQRLDVAEVVKYFKICQKHQTNTFASRFSRTRGGQARATIVQAGCQAQGKTFTSQHWFLPCSIFLDSVQFFIDLQGWQVLAMDFLRKWGHLMWVVHFEWGLLFSKIKKTVFKTLHNAAIVVRPE